MTSQFFPPFRPPHHPFDPTTSFPFNPQESSSSIEYASSSVTAVVEVTTSGTPPTSTVVADSAGSETSGDDKTKIIGGIIGGFFLGVLVTVAIFMALCRRRRTQVTKRDTENASKCCSSPQMLYSPTSLSQEIIPHNIIHMKLLSPRLRSL
jgi:hypothetical protein